MQIKRFMLIGLLFILSLLVIGCSDEKSSSGNDEIISTGYNGAPRGRKNCIDLGYCMREKLNIPRGERYELCRSVHAEENAIISASRSRL